MASYQYIYVMQNLSKVFPGGKELFKNQFRISKRFHAESRGSHTRAP